MVLGHAKQDNKERQGQIESPILWLKCVEDLEILECSDNVINIWLVFNAGCVMLFVLLI